MPTVLLCHCDGTNGSSSFTDSSSFAHTLTPTNCLVSTTAPKFGTGCASYSAGSTAKIDTGNAVDFRFGSGQFTVEAWGWFTATPALTQAIISQWGVSGQFSWFFGGNSGQWGLYYSTTGSNNTFFGAAYSPTLNTWIHLAADRDASNVLRIYANGVVITSTTLANTFFASTANCMIGNDVGNGGRGFPGFLDEVRVTVGTAVYAGPFTPPTGPFGGAATAQAIAMVLA